MSASDLLITASPHLGGGDTTPRIMWSVVASLVPIVLAATWFFGLSVPLVLAAALAGAGAAEWAFGRPGSLADGSGVITGLLLGLTLPAGLPLWMAFIGGAFSIGIGKLIFGGLGQNVFNPALLGRAFLMATYPVLTTTWAEPRTVEKALDAVTAATPLALAKFEGKVDFNLLDMLIGNTAGSLGETSAIAIILGGLYLRYKGYINWKLPLGYLGTIAAFSAIFWLANPAKYPNPLFHLLAGGAMLGAWFMVTDMVTSPTTSLGQWIFVICAGIMAVVIRLFGGLPEGVMYSILFMNAFVPLLNKHTRPRVFGARRAIE